jgi:antitoxin component of MazEF toxin-antitoxin module
MSGDDWVRRVFEPALRTINPPFAELRGAVRALGQASRTDSDPKVQAMLRTVTDGVSPPETRIAEVALYRAILVYTEAMKVVKVRRVGNSNVISLPREFEAHGYAPGSSVLVEKLPGGELRIMSTEKVRERIRNIGERVVADHAEALQILADHDPDTPRT